MNESYVFDEPQECVERALRGFERKAARDIASTDKEVLSALQERFPEFTRTDLSVIMINFDDVGDFNI